MIIILQYLDQVLEGSRCDFERGWCGWVNMVKKKKKTPVNYLSVNF